MDRKTVSEQYLDEYGADYDYHPKNLRQGHKLIDVDCSEFDSVIPISALIPIVRSIGIMD